MLRSSLALANSDPKNEKAHPQQVELSKIFSGKINVRKDPGDVSDLLQSVRAKGIIEPVIVRPSGGRFELIVGSRRFKAAKTAGMKKIPAMVMAMTDEEAIIISLVENIQRKNLEPEEEYDGLMSLRKTNPDIYGSTEDLAKAIGKSRRYVEDHINAVETVRALRKETKADVTVRQAPSFAERQEGVLPIKHATFLHKAEEAPTVQRLSEGKRAEKLSELAQMIAPMPQPEAEKVVDHFVMSPKKPMDEIRRQVESLRAVKLEVLVDPRIAEGLTKAAEERKTTMEAIVTLAIHSWLRQQRYL